MNKTVAYMGVVGIVIVGFVGVIVIQALQLDAGPFMNLFNTTLPIAITAAVTFYGLDKMNVKTDQIGRNVNGNISRLIELAKRGVLSPEERQEIERIDAQRDNDLGEFGRD